MSPRLFVGAAPFKELSCGAQDGAEKNRSSPMKLIPYDRIVYLLKCHIQLETKAQINLSACHRLTVECDSLMP